MYKYKNRNCRVLKSRYSNNRIALVLVDEDGIPEAKATINVVEDTAHKRSEVTIKNYSENEGMYEWLLRNQIVRPAHRFVYTGYTKCPVCYLTETFINNG